MKMNFALLLFENTTMFADQIANMMGGAELRFVGQPGAHIVFLSQKKTGDPVCEST